MPVPGNLPSVGQHLFERVMSSLKGKTNPRTKKPYTDEERAKIAWSAVKNKYKKKADGWELKSIPEEDWEFCFNSEPLEFKSEEGNYYFTGYLSTFDLDLVNDIVTPSCMQDMLTQIKMGMNGIMRSFKGSPDHDVYWFEDPQLKPISRIVNATLDNHGILVKGMFNPAHPEFNWQEIQNGFYDGLSIEYRPLEFSFKEANGKKMRVLNKIQLKGYGHTPRPANPFSKLVDCFVKSLDVADVEDELKSEDIVRQHLEKDMKTWEELSVKAKEEAESDRKLIKELDEVKSSDDVYDPDEDDEDDWDDEDEEVIKARVTAQEGTRKKKKMSETEYYAFPRLKKLPIFDAAHVRNAMARFNQTQGMSAEEKATAKRKIIGAAKKFKIEVGEFAETKEEKNLVDEKKDEPQPTPTPQAEVKDEPEEVEPEAEAEEEKAEVKTLDLKALEEQIKSIVKEELKSLIPKKEVLSDNSDKFSDESKSMTLTDHVVKRLGG